MTSVTQPPNHPEPDHRQAVIERQAEIIDDLQRQLQKVQAEKVSFQCHAEVSEEELARGDAKCAWITGVGTVGWVLALYYILR